MAQFGESILELPPPAADRQLRYGGGPHHFGDLFLPAGSGPHPWAMGLHGGFWRARYDLAHLGHLCAAVAQAGVACFSLEYRRVGHEGGGVPGTLDDVREGLAFLRRSAAALNLDPRRGTIFGHSAGGQLALWLGGEESGVDSVVGLAPLSDLALAFQLGLGAGIVGDFLGGSPDAVPARYRLASPRERLPGRARQLVVHGALDDTVPHSMSQAYVEAARQAGAQAELLSFPDAGHYELIDPRCPQGQAVVSAIVDRVR